MKPTTTENGATETNPGCPRFRIWSCTPPKGAGSVSHSGDYSISSQRECRKNRVADEPADGTSPPPMKHSGPGAQRTPAKSIRERCLDSTGGVLMAEG